MERKRQDQRSAETRALLIETARPLFAARGYGDVGTEEVVRAAGVTRGALYHQFEGKLELFAAVFEAVEADVTTRVAQAAIDAGVSSPLAALRASTSAWLDACADPEVLRIVLLDAPAVLGWERFRDITLRYGLGLAEAALGAAMDAGEIQRRPLRALAHVLLGALDEAALYIAQAEDPASARQDVDAVVDGLLGAL